MASEESLSLILLGVGNMTLNPMQSAENILMHGKWWSQKWDFQSFFIHPLPFAQILGSYPQGPRVGSGASVFPFVAPL